MRRLVIAGLVVVPLAAAVALGSAAAAIGQLLERALEVE